MKTEEREKMREYVRRWKETGAFLENLKIAEFRRASLAETILSLSDASESALLKYPPRPSSGLVEMHEILLRVKNK
jgi:hypothetical protein